MITKIRFKKQFQALGMSILTLNLKEHPELKVSFGDIKGMGHMVILEKDGYIGILKPVSDLDWVEDDEYGKAAPVKTEEKPAKPRAFRSRKPKSDK
jgi:hypothetical protein